MSDEFKLEAMQQGDVSEVGALIARAMNREEGWAARGSISYHFHLMGKGTHDGRDYFVWRPKNKINGIVGLHHYDWGPPANIWLGWFAVRPRFQRQGIGTQLLAAIEGIAKSSGYRKLFVETYSSADFAKARSFYKSRGFTKVGTISDYMDDGSSMVVFMKRL
jgi:GNAT superfamily N-acetyltransferase